MLPLSLIPVAYAMISTNAEDRPEIGEVCVRASKMRVSTSKQRTGE